MVRPIELTDLFAKTTAAEKVMQIEKSAPEMAQRQFEFQLAMQQAEKQTKTTPLKKTDEAIIHRDKDKEKKRDKRKKKKDSEKKDDSQMSIDVKA